MGVASIADRLLVARGRLHDDQRHPNATMIATFLANGAEVAAPSPDPSPMLLPHTICARGGRKGVVPMRDLRMDGVRLIFGSAHVSSRNPEWYSTLLLDPEVDLEQRTDRIPARRSSALDQARRDLRALGHPLRHLQHQCTASGARHHGHPPGWPRHPMADHAHVCVRHCPPLSDCHRATVCPSATALPRAPFSPTSEANQRVHVACVTTSRSPPDQALRI